MSTNEAYIAYPDESVNAFVVQKFNGNNWIQVGNSMGSTGGLSGVALAFDENTNEAYIAYPDDSTDFVVQKFNGDNWIQVGTDFGLATPYIMGVTTPSLSFNPITNEAFVAYPDGEANAFVVQKFDGSNWAQVGNDLGVTIGNSAVALIFGPHENEAFIAYPDDSVHGFVVKKIQLQESMQMKPRT